MTFTRQGAASLLAVVLLSTYTAVGLCAFDCLLTAPVPASSGSPEGHHCGQTTSPADTATFRAAETACGGEHADATPATPAAGRASEISLAAWTTPAPRVRQISDMAFRSVQAPTNDHAPPGAPVPLRI